MLMTLAGPANQKQDGQKHHVFQSTDEVFHFETDDVVGVVPGDKVLELEDEASSRCWCSVWQRVWLVCAVACCVLWNVSAPIGPIPVKWGRHRTMRHRFFSDKSNYLQSVFLRRNQDENKWNNFVSKTSRNTASSFLLFFFVFFFFLIFIFYFIF